MNSNNLIRKVFVRTLSAAAVIGALAVTPAFAGDDSKQGDDKDRGVYYVTLTNLTYAQGFSFPVAATHDSGFHMFQVGQNATSAAAQIAQNGNPKPMFDFLEMNLGGAVSDAYGHPFPMAAGGAGSVPWAVGLPYFDATGMPTGLFPTATAHTLYSDISFTIAANKKDRFSLLVMLMCTNDGLAGLDSVKLPGGLGEAKRYDIYGYDAGVEVNTEKSADIVDPCGLMAPRAADGSPQVSTSDGNRNSPPSGAATVIQTMDPIAPFTNPTLRQPSGSNIPANFAWDARKPVGVVTITRVD